MDSSLLQICGGRISSVQRLKVVETCVKRREYFLLEFLMLIFRDMKIALSQHLQFKRQEYLLLGSSKHFADALVILTQ